MTMRTDWNDQAYTAAEASTAQTPSLDEMVDALWEIEATMPERFDAIVCPVEHRAEIERVVRREPAVSISPSPPLSFWIQLYFYSNPLECNQIIKDLKDAGVKRIALIEELPWWRNSRGTTQALGRVEE